EVTLIVTQAEDPLMVEAHAESLGKMVEHLVSNALKFTPRGGSVWVETREMDRRTVQVRVTDTGRGIPPEALAYVFQKFFHVDQTLARPSAGMGLGLAYCKEVLEAHKGRIWVEPPGAGLGPPVSFPPPRPPAAPAAPGKRTILWIDDNPSMLELVEYGF